MSKLAIDSNAKPIQVLRPTATQTVSVSGTAANATAISTNARVARIICDTAVFYSVTGTATTSSVYLPADTVEFVHVYSGDVISLITSSATGTAYIAEMV